jgi:hypothetical protein
VFRTPIGFHDAYVAAPSRKAALQAWGSERDLFARGAAEEVDDPKLMEEPLAKPGEVVRRARGTAAEQLAALPKDGVRSRRSAGNRDGDEKRGGAAPASRRKRTPQPKPAPKPRTDRLEAAERSLDRARDAHRRALDEIARREGELARERRRLEQDRDREVGELEEKLEEERAAYERAMRDWRG